MKDRFNHFAAIDWSGAMGERQKGIAVAICDSGFGALHLVRRGHRWSRAEVLHWLLHDMPPDTLVGMDLSLSLPFDDCKAFFPGWSESPDDARALWAMVERICAADRHLGVSSFVNDDNISPYFRRHGKNEGSAFRTAGEPGGQGRFRVTELQQKKLKCRPYSNFNLVGAAQVGKSSLSGMRLLHRLAGALPVWPIDPLSATGSTLVEIYTTIAAIKADRKPGKSKMYDFTNLNNALAVLGADPLPESGTIDDHSSDALLTAAWLRKYANDDDLWNPAELTPLIAATEGWTFGVP